MTGDYSSKVEMNILAIIRYLYFSKHPRQGYRVRLISYKPSARLCKALVTCSLAPMPHKSRKSYPLPLFQACCLYVVYMSLVLEHIRFSKYQAPNQYYRTHQYHVQLCMPISKAESRPRRDSTNMTSMASATTPFTDDETRRVERVRGSRDVAKTTTTKAATYFFPFEGDLKGLCIDTSPPILCLLSIYDSRLYPRWVVGYKCRGLQGGPYSR
jgi:hypothetical protein